MKHRLINKGLVFNCLLFAGLFLLVLNGINITQRHTKQQQKQIYTNAIKQAALNCYGIEGFYPNSLTYLHDNYGLIINDNFNVYYEIVASNLMPIIKVVEK